MQEKKPWALIDADDTLIGPVVEGRLIGTNEAYRYYADRFYQAMSELGFSIQETRETQMEILEGLCRKHGFSQSGLFAQSFRHTYRVLCLRHHMNFSHSVAEDLEHLGWQVYEFSYSPFPGALEVLRAVASVYRVAIVTKGPEKQQKKKVAESGCLEFAQAFIAMNTKSVKEWQERVVLPLGISLSLRRESFVVGDSVRSEINPALKLGFNAIHVVNPNTWSFEHEEYIEPETGLILQVVDNISEAVKYFKLLKK